MNSQTRLLHKQGGFTLLELLVVLMIIALLAGFVGPKVFSNVDSAKDKTAQRQMRAIADAMVQYRLDVGHYPDESEGLRALTEKPASAQNWKGPYLSHQVPLDPWGQAYQWHNPTREQGSINDVDITSMGKGDKAITYGF
ncbi:type II secretion system major pseudopilin GspG [Pantoea sp. WMus005]|uniref:type II secretion system major pseudopilin GspG n=1 Tax=Pantoea sp. WMus005 TaxID=2750734 RepID=UPI0015D08E60|nr:type II secretion system major pseudopilin GspG [Pantoea sp. WMus005]NYS30047.1 type II secretion system major pseudopilin GspG [Pantoea sp. WMus005]